MAIRIVAASFSLLALASAAEELRHVAAASGAQGEGAETCSSISTLPASREQALLQLSGKALLAKRLTSNNTGNVIGYPSTGGKKARNLWCEVEIPPDNWNLKSCPASGSTEFKVLSYNLFWWNLFKKHYGGDRSAGGLIRRTGGAEKYDIMGFQECDDMWRVLHDAGLHHAEYGAINGGRAIAVAWRKTKWSLISHDSVDVGEDSRDQYYGKRSAMWVRLRNAEGKTVFFMNHHGPLMVSQGGGCTGSATALNIMKVIANNAHSEDVIVLVGDFNAALGSSRVQELERRLNRVHSGYIFGGVDHVFSNCGARGQGKTLEKGDGYWKSDHNAISATFKI